MNVIDLILVVWAACLFVALGMMLSAYASNRPYKTVEMLALAILSLLFSILVLLAAFIISEAGVGNIIVVQWL